MGAQATWITLEIIQTKATTGERSTAVRPAVFFAARFPILIVQLDIFTAYLLYVFPTRVVCSSRTFFIHKKSTRFW